MVPQKLFGSQQGVTASEMRWLLNHPERMNSVHFVFRAYKTYSNKDIINLGEKLKEDYKDSMIERIFRQLQTDLSLPQEEYNVENALIDLENRIEIFKQSMPVPFEGCENKTKDKYSSPLIEELD